MSTARIAAKANVAFTPADVYGQVHPIETPELVKERLEDLDDELCRVSSRGGWLQALSKCPQIVDDKFKLQFLRCELFNVKMAAQRIVKHWDERIQLFGSEKAFLPLTQEGALRDDENALKMSFLCLTGTADETGRQIVYCDLSKLDISKNTRESMARTAWYTISAALEDETSQQKGIVLIVNPRKAKYSQFDRRLARLSVNAMQGRLPVRLSAIHVVHSSYFFSIVYAVIKLFLRERTKKRFIFHSGSQDKVLESLSKMGLSLDVLPVDIGGKIVIDQQQWLESRRLKERNAGANAETLSLNGTISSGK